MADVTKPVEQWIDLADWAFQGAGSDSIQSRSVALALINAELVGQAGHGLRRFPSYSAQLLAHKVNPDPHIKVAVPRPAVAHIDADFGFAYPAIDKAIEFLLRAAQSNGIALAAIHRSHHAGVAGLHVQRLAENGFVALMFANSPAAMAPWGGKTPLFGTNPIAFAAPVTGGDPIVVDVSLSKVARGKVMAAQQKGEAIPEGWAFDKDGKPTTDADAAMAGTMAPSGDAKGTALALMVELLAAGLTGGNYAYEASSLFDDKGPPPGLGQTIIAIDPSAFGGSAPTERFAEMARRIADEEGARLPGARRVELARKLEETGLTIPADLHDMMQALANKWADEGLQGTDR